MNISRNGDYILSRLLLKKPVRSYTKVVTLFNKPLIFEETYMYQEINVTSFYFAKGNVSKSFPRRIETTEGQQINFIENGLRCVVQKGQELIQIFNMTDGEKLYRLGFEPSKNSWKLLSTRVLSRW